MRSVITVIKVNQSISPSLFIEHDCVLSKFNIQINRADLSNYCMQKIKKVFVFIFGRVKRMSEFRRLAERYMHSYKIKNKFLPFPKPVHLQKVKQ